MRNSSKLILITLLAAGSSFRDLPAQDTTRVPSVQDTTRDSLPAAWSLAYCIEYATKNNIQITTLQLSEQSSEQDVLQAKAAKLPNLTGSATQELVNSKNINPIVGGFQSQASFSGDYSVNTSLTIFNGGYLNQNIKAMRLAEQTANLNVAEAQNNITLTITQDYINILLAQENIKYLEDLVNTSQAQLDQGKQLYSGGSLARKDFVQLEATAASDRYSLVSAKNAQQLDIVALKQLLQLPTAYDFKVVTPDTLIIQQAVPSLAEAQREAQLSRPEVKMGEVGIESAQVILQEAKAEEWPTLSVGGGLLSGYSNNEDFKYFTQLNNNFYQELGLSLDVPIYSRRVNRTAIEKNKIAIEQAKLSLEETQITLNQNVEDAYINLESAEAQYVAADTEFVTSEESYDIENEQLKLGSVDLVDLLQQKNLYIQALEQYIQAKYNAILNIKIYNFYTGVPITL